MSQKATSMACLAREQQTSTFLGNGIALGTGATDTRDQVLKTGVQVFQFPEGVTWGDGRGSVRGDRVLLQLG
ncbi:hypothetical protein ACNKHU_13330 [Shigella flexneri]